MTEEMKDDVEMESDSSEEEEENDEEEEKKQNEKLKELDGILEADPTAYQAHLDRVALLKQMGELIKLREAREAFSKVEVVIETGWDIFR